MKKPQILCPACLEVYHRVNFDDYVSICSIIYSQFLNGQSNYENYTVLPSHCENYTSCNVWREVKEKGWARKTGSKYSSMNQMEQLRI